MYTIHAQVFNVLTEKHELREIMSATRLSQAIEHIQSLARYGETKACVYVPQSQRLYIADTLSMFVRENVPSLPACL